ncbi:VP4 [Micromonas pusilla reovirus]|uniref:Uncharacterized protein VP4 n=1 Tax=Micromonas pusilla reovirus (isolate Netherlands/2005) TaxID=649596 RepID=VP4_MPRVN|nr:VP4 [Micromonas pusilla reovirus]Q1I0U8.1 RecName: Full=Uncharacterized protein VP4 [Micromonas pusilla reovirus (isolate Netherlands)]AAZ94044.1 VP4 [Micromonas pusilla reovirus]
MNRSQVEYQSEIVPDPLEQQIPEQLFEGLQVAENAVALTADTFSPDVFGALVSRFLTVFTDESNTPQGYYPIWDGYETNNLGNPGVFSGFINSILVAGTGNPNFHSDITDLLGDTGPGISSEHGYLLPGYGTRITRRQPIPLDMLEHARGTLVEARTSYGQDGRGPTYQSGNQSYVSALRSMFTGDVASSLIADERGGGHISGALANGLFNVAPVVYKTSEIGDTDTFKRRVSNAPSIGDIKLVINGQSGPDLKSEKDRIYQIPDDDRYVTKITSHCDLDDRKLIVEKVKLNVPRRIKISAHAKADYNTIVADSLRTALVAAFNGKVYDCLQLRSSEDHGPGVVIENMPLHEYPHKSMTLSGETTITAKARDEFVNVKFDTKSTSGTISIPITKMKFVFAGIMKYDPKSATYTYSATNVVTNIFDGDVGVARLRRSPIRVNKRSYDYNDDRNFRPESLKAEISMPYDRRNSGAVIHGLHNVLERYDLERKLETHDPWTGLPFSNSIMSPPGEDDNLLRYSGIEYDDIHAIYTSPSTFNGTILGLTSPSGKEIVERVADMCLHMLLSQHEVDLYGRDIIASTKLSDPKLSQAIKLIKARLQREIYDKSAITSMHDKLWFTNVNESVAPDDRIVVDIMLARYLLSLTHHIVYPISEDTYRSTLLLPPRINKAKYIPVSLSEEGYRVVTPTLSVVYSYFMKEPGSRQLLKQYISKDGNFKQDPQNKLDWLSAINRYEPRNFKELVNNSTQGRIELHAIVRAPLVEVTYESVLDGTYTHCIICDNCKIITLDYLIQSTVYQLCTKSESMDGVQSVLSKVHNNGGKLFVIYDKWFILLFVIPEKTDVPPIVFVQTSTRAARIVPHTKNTNSSLRRADAKYDYEVLMQSAVSCDLLYMSKTIEWSSGRRVGQLLRDRSVKYA